MGEVIQGSCIFEVTPPSLETQATPKQHSGSGRKVIGIERDNGLQSWVDGKETQLTGDEVGRKLVLVGSSTYVVVVAEKDTMHTQEG